VILVEERERVTVLVVVAAPLVAASDIDVIALIRLPSTVFIRKNKRGESFKK